MASVCIRAGVLFLVMASLSSREFLPRPVPPLLAMARQPESDPLTESNPLIESSPLTVADLQRRGTITFLMHHSAASSFLYRGEQMGFEYELALAFAKELGVELQVLTPPPDVELTSWLKAGQGDVIAGLFIDNESQEKSLRVSLPYLETRAQILTSRVIQGVEEVTELAGEIIAVQPDTLYTHQLFSLSSTWPLAPILTTVPSDDGINNAVMALERGQATAMLVPALIADITRRVYPGKLQTLWTAPEPVRLVWAVRPEQTDLLRAIDDYLERANRSGLKKILFEKYFVKAEYLRDITRVPESTLMMAKRLSRYDHLIARRAEEAGFDWRLVAALIFEESRFDNQRVSEAGAYGLMQITPMAAQDMGVKNYTAPRGNITAGVKYLQTLARQFPYGQPDDRLALILAGYFLGAGHVEDAQRLARVLGYDPHCWEESMELVLPLLEDPAHYTQTLYGSAPGSRAVHYVNAIQKRYALYSQYVTRALTSVTPPTPPVPQAASAAG